MNKQRFIILLTTIMVSSCCTLGFCEDSIQPHPCDFYGNETLSGSLFPGNIITAQDPDGVVIGQTAIVESGFYGFLSCKADDPATTEDEGAVEGDTISFFIDGVAQQKQAVWRSGSSIQVDIGTPLENGVFNLHLYAMPAYSSYSLNTRYSGAAVADMILDFLDPENSDTQLDLMAYADNNADGITNADELTDLLNRKAPHIYNFGTTITLETMSNYGSIGPFDSSNQDDCLKQLCHWMTYKVPNAESGLEYVPSAVCTSSDPATSADSDYSHWMSLVGVKTNKDPFPILPEESSFSSLYQVPEALELYGVYLNDPGEEGLGFHTYIAADVWKKKYFRPIKEGLKNSGKYIAVMEPPEEEASDVVVVAPQYSSALQDQLNLAQESVSIYIPSWVGKSTKDYLSSLLENLSASEDYCTLDNDEYFGTALEDVRISRCYKVDGVEGNDYTILPLEKIGTFNTTAALIANNETGQFQIAFADNDSDSIYKPMQWYKAYFAIRKEIGWGSEFTMNSYLSSETGSLLYPGWSITTAVFESQKGSKILRSKKYSVTTDEEARQKDASAKINIDYKRSYNTRIGQINLVSFEVESDALKQVAIDYKRNIRRDYLYTYNNKYFLITVGEKNSYCRLKVEDDTSDGNFS
ncbi:MAG: hypothetical protein ABIB11_02560, partial [Candidatus Omnitrophota bacterium]